VDVHGSRRLGLGPAKPDKRSGALRDFGL
jgi:hypothetical protein